MSVPQLYDTVVVGGGIIGCFTAYFLSKAGQRVLVCERDKIANEQSGRAWGFIRQQGRHPAELPLMREALDLWDEFNEEFGIGETDHVKAGVIVPAETTDDEKFLRRSLSTAKSLSLPTELISPEELKHRVPEIAGNWRCALQTSGDGHADPCLSTHSVSRRSKALGVEFVEGRVVTGFVRSKGKVLGVQTDKGEICADNVVVAGGIGSRNVMKKLDFNAPIQIVRSSVVQTTKAQPFTKIAMWCPTVSFRPARDGSFVIGNGFRGAGTDTDITLESFTNMRFFLRAFRRNYKHLKLTLSADMFRSVADLLNGDKKFAALPEPRLNHRKVQSNLLQFKKLFPHLQDVETWRSWAGRLDITPDLIPLIDRHQNYANVFMAFGFSGHGFALGPSIGQQLSQWVCSGQPTLDLSKFKHTRFQDGDYQIVDAM